MDEGSVLATRRPPVEGTAGMDVLGQTLEPRPLKDPALDPLAGQNTEVRGDSLVATQPGRPTMRGDRIDVLPVYEVAGDLDYSVGNIEFAGDVVVRGDVKPGFSIVATGSVVVGGMVEHGTIHAGGDITLQGVVGGGQPGEEDDEERVELHAGEDLMAQYMQNVSARADGEIKVNREIVNCTLSATRVTTSPTGRIVGGNVTATSEISSGSLGSQTGTSTRLSVPTARSDDPIVVRAHEAVYPGVKIHVSGAMLDVEDGLRGASFWQLNGEVVRLDALAGAEDLAQLAREIEEATKHDDG